jgi:hypothetical protein
MTAVRSFAAQQALILRGFPGSSAWSRHTNPAFDNLRNRVTLENRGKLYDRTRRYHCRLFGAEEFGFATAP